MNNPIVLKKRIPDPGNQLTLILLLASVIGCLLVFVRSNLSNNATYQFLIWNLFLAWVPFIISSLFIRSDFVKRKWYYNIAWGCLWLLFFPNAPYILTDLVHLKPRSDVPFWYDFLILIFFCFNSTFLAFASLIQIKRALDFKLPAWLSHLVILTILQLTSFGIYLGRFERYNSWDLFTKPFKLSREIYHLILNSDMNHQMYYIVFFLAIFLNLNYFTLLIINKSIYQHPKSEK